MSTVASVVNLGGCTVW